MDHEAVQRKSLLKALSADFACFEEVTLSHPIFLDKSVRADVVAIPFDSEFWGYALSFEVKNPTEDWGSAEWSKAVHQAAGYVGGTIKDGSDARIADYVGRVIAASFIYPSPPVSPRGDTSKKYPGLMGRDIQRFSGVMQLALHFRVGHAYQTTSPSGANQRLVLSFGTNNIYRSDTGFGRTAKGLLDGKRRLGSSKINLLKDRNGFGDNVERPWE